MKRLFCLLLLFCLTLSLPAQASGFSFPDVFLPEGEEPLRTETGYRSANVAFEITACRVDTSDVYVVDFYVRSLDNLQRVFAGEPWDKTADKIRTMAEESGALLALSGDNSRQISEGWVFGNGELLRRRTNTKRDLCVIYDTGEMDVFIANQFTDDDLIACQDRIWHSFLFGPSLLNEDGSAIAEFTSPVRNSNPRSVIGYYEPGHYCFVQVDGRGTDSALEEKRINTGMTLTQLAAFMEQLGCAVAYNLDGGQSSMLWYDGDVISTPYRGGRTLGDILILHE